MGAHVVAALGGGGHLLPWPSEPVGGGEPVNSTQARVASGLAQLAFPRFPQVHMYVASRRKEEQLAGLCADCQNRIRTQASKFVLRER